MAGDGVLNVRIVSPERVVYEGEASALVVPAWDGSVGILPGHAPFMSLLGAGALAVELPGGGSDEYFVAGGVLKVDRNDVTLLTEYAGTEAPERLPDDAAISPEEILEATAAPDA